MDMKTKTPEECKEYIVSTFQPGDELSVRMKTIEDDESSYRGILKEIRDDYIVIDMTPSGGIRHLYFDDIRKIGLFDFEKTYTATLLKEGKTLG